MYVLWEFRVYCTEFSDGLPLCLQWGDLVYIRVVHSLTMLTIQR